ncbi:MAG: DUF523 domain-containing protein [Bacillus subtilis]|nr:DUF523 domain-containing protein [Bacillus subtilis]
MLVCSDIIANTTGRTTSSLPVIEYVKGKKIIPFCPEVFGGLDTPRIPSERQEDGRVLNKEGKDVTFCFHRGTQLTWEVLKKHHCTHVILKDGSPSCGYKTIYDGTFSNTKIAGLGVTAQFLKEKALTSSSCKQWSASR